MSLEKSRIVMVLLVVAVLGGTVGLIYQTQAGQPNEQRAAANANEAKSKTAVYHADPDHLWNRLHEALFVRVGPDGRAYGQDRLEPLLWPRSKHLLEERSHKRAVAVLEELLKDKGERLIEDPLKRAVLQRDLWLVFSWLEGDHNGFEEPALEPEAARAAQARLRRLLAAVIGRLCLSPHQIKKLPDSYAAAVASGEFPKKYNPERPDQPYLPPDLFAGDGPWVCLGRPDGPMAPEHLLQSGNNVYTSSAFLVFLRLPAGRATTLDYLQRLRSFDHPLLVQAEEARPRELLPNPKLPRLPVGAEVALVRRALLIDSSHAVVPSALTESVQLRVYREIPEVTTRTMTAALVGGTAANRRAQSWQSFQEFRLSRSRLFAGRAGGLRPVGVDERDFKTGFGSHTWDQFEYRGYRPPGRSFAEASQEPIRQSCFSCHSLPGVSSFNSFFNYRNNLQGSDTARPFSLSEMPVSKVAGAAVKWNEGRPSWIALRKLLSE